MSNATVIEVQLLAGRYHAHLWGESQFAMAGPEWPPSPWRLLRAIASAWFSAGLPLSSEGDRDALLEMLGRAKPPEMWLPKTSFHQLRYYQPVRMGGSDRVLHHDFYAVPEGGKFWFHFDVSLTDQQQDLLGQLLGRLRYLGRSESRGRLRLVNLPEPPPGAERVAPRTLGMSLANVTHRPVLCPAPDFRPSDLWEVRNAAPGAGTASHPVHLVDALLDRRMPLPNGAHWVEYAVPEAILVHEIQPPASPAAPKPDVQVAEIHFRLNRRIPIPLQSLVAVARAFRDAAAARHRKLTGSDSPMLTGREANGTMARGHRHAFYLPRLADTALTIDRLVVRIPTSCLTAAEMDALLGVGRINIGSDPYPINVIPEQTTPEWARPGTAACWRSITPFVPPLRHRPGRDGTVMEEQAAMSAERVCGVRPVRVQKRHGPGGVGAVSAILAHQYLGAQRDGRNTNWTFTRRLGFWLELTFDQPIDLAAPLGADAHFGAGQFRPCST